MELSAIPKRIFTGFPNPEWRALIHHLFNAHVPKKLANAIGENATNDKNNEFRKEMIFRRVAEVHISKTFNEFGEMDFAHYGEQATSPQLRDTSSRFPTITLIGTKKRRINRLVK